MDRQQFTMLVQTASCLLGWIVDRGAALVALPTETLTRWYEARASLERARAAYHAERDRVDREPSAGRFGKARTGR